MPLSIGPAPMPSCMGPRPFVCMIAPSCDRQESRTVVVLGRWGPRAIWLIAAFLAIHLARFVNDGFQRPVHGFVSHYTASKLVAQGEEAARFYDDDWFKAHVVEYEPTVADPYGANLPTMSLLMLPLTVFDYQRARVVWTGVSLVLLVVTLVILMWQLHLTAHWMAVYCCYVLLYQPLYENLLHGQMYVLALALLTVSWCGFRSAKGWPTGGALGTLLATKTAALMVWPLLLMHRRWQALTWGGGTILAVVGLSLPWLGVNAWTAYWEVAVRLPSEAFLSVTAYQTQLSFFRHLFIYDEQWNPSPLFNSPLAGMMLPWIGAAILLGVSAAVAFIRRNPDLLFAAFVLLSLVLSPVSLDYHYVIALIPIALLLSHWQHRMVSWEGLALITGAILIAADFPYRSASLADAAWAFFAYPKLYGALLLWGLALVSCVQSSGPESRC